MFFFYHYLLSQHTAIRWKKQRPCVDNMQTPQIWVRYRVIHVSSDRSRWRKNLTTGTLMAWCSSRTWWWWMLKRNWYSIVCDTLIVLKLNTWYLKHVVIFALDIEMNCGKKTAQHITCKTNHTLMLWGLHSHTICGLFNKSGSKLPVHYYSNVEVHPSWICSNLLCHCLVRWSVFDK